MKTRVAVMSIIVDEKDSVEVLNAVLHEFGDHIIGRYPVPSERHTHYFNRPRCAAGHNFIIGGKAWEYSGTERKDGIFQRRER